jgi:hypothetical protein
MVCPDTPKYGFLFSAGVGLEKRNPYFWRGTECAVVLSSSYRARLVGLWLVQISDALFRSPATTSGYGWALKKALLVPSSGTRANTPPANQWHPRGGDYSSPASPVSAPLPYAAHRWSQAVHKA